MKLRTYPDYLWRRLLHNLPQKALALLAAVGIWLLATQDRRASVERTFDVSLAVTDGTPGVQRRGVSGLPRTVRVTLQGQRSLVQPLEPADVRASVDVTGVPQGNFQETVHVAAPDGVRVARLSPTSVSGFLDAESTRTLPVSVTATDLPQNAIPRYEVTPQAVRVSGAKRSVDTVSRVITAPVALEAGRSREARLIAVTASGAPVTDARTDPTTVTVRRLDSGELPVKIVRVVLPDPPATLQVVASDIEPASVRLVSNTETLARLREATAKVPYQVGKYSVRAGLELPDGVRSLDSVVVTLEVRRKAP